MGTQSQYQPLLQRSLRVNWNLDDLIDDQSELDFSKPFLPETYARTEALGFLTPEEQLMLNHIRARGYLAMFGLVEEFILPFVLDHMRQQLDGDDYRLRALLQFASEEAKHIHLFRRFEALFDRSFDVSCPFIGPPEDIRAAVLSHQPLAVAIAVLGIEWMSQGHYLHSVKDNEDLDPLFKSLLKHHWQEEAQHARMDELMLAALAENADAATVRAAVDEYFEIGMFLDGGLKQQTEFDLEALQMALGRQLSEEQRNQFLTEQHQALRWTFLGSGMSNRNFLKGLEILGDGPREKIAGAASAFC